MNRIARFALILQIALVTGCASSDPRGDADDDAMPDAATQGGGDGDGDDGTGGVPGVDGGTDAPAPTCRPNPGNPTCAEICPEQCNGIDDDCDGKLDEDPDDGLCGLDNAQTLCVRATCLITACNEGFRDCDGLLENGCEADLASVEHCGGCNIGCHIDNTITACVDGGCEPAGCVQPYLDCLGGDGICETFGETLHDCGACGATCESPPRATPACIDGGCAVDECQGNFGDCNGDVADGCELQLADVSNCGGCDVACAYPGSGTSCNSGACVVESCSAGYADCDGSVLTACDALDSDTHCGGCDQACTVDALQHVVAAGCVDRTCEAQCEALFGDCDPDPGCETPLTRVSNCGGCGVLCSPPHAIGICDDGSCGVGACDLGWADCDGVPGNGCETDLGRPDNCGGCGNQCPPMIGCDGDICSGISCPEGQADCNDVDSCDFDLSDDASCGSCNVRCEFDANLDGHGSVACAVDNATPGQMAWGCEVSCDGGFADCDGDYRNGCEVDLTDVDNCGGCGNVCTKLHAAPTCENGICEVGTCNADWGDCDGDGLTCETSLASADHCGQCNNDCNFPQALGLCSGSPGNRRCIIGGCSPIEYEDCDGEANTGCEANTTSDVANCNGCGNDCNAVPNAEDASCQDSACVFTCANGYDDCNGAPGCETNLVLNTSCGSCNNDCTALPDVLTTSCNAGGGNPSCSVQSCRAGFGDCDGNAGNGCEIDTATSETHCGACSGDPGHTPCDGLQNVADSRCTGGSCAIVSCSGNFEDCNRVLSDGCEWDPSVDGQCCDPMADADGDGVDDCADQCPSDPGKAAPGTCGCFVSDADSDGDGAKDCVEDCDLDPAKTAAGICGCGVSDADADGDGTPDCMDNCPKDPARAVDCAASCKVLHDEGIGASGSYILDLDGPGGIAPMAVGCDMMSQGGGWTEITLQMAHQILGGAMIALESADVEGIDGSHRPFTQRTGAGHVYHYTFAFPPGYTQFWLSGYQIRANSGAGHNTEIDPPDSMCAGCGFAQSVWGVGYRGQYDNNPPRGNIGDVSFGTPDDAGPVTSYGAELATQWQCEACTSDWPAGSAVYTLGASSAQFRVGWGEVGGQTEGLYPWWSGTIKLR